MVKVHRTFVVKPTPFSLAVFSFSTLFGSVGKKGKIVGMELSYNLCPNFPGLARKQDGSKWSQQIRLYLFGAQFFHSLNPFLK